MGLFKRGGIFYARIKGTDGKWRKTTLNTSDRVVARGKYRDLERETADPSYRAANETSLADAAREFERSRTVKGCADGTMQMYGVKLAHLERLLGEDLPLSRIDAPLVDQYVVTRLDEGAARNTIGKELTALRGLLKVARRAGKFSRDLAEVMPAEWSNEYEPRRTALTRAQVRALIKYLPRRRAAFVAFVVGTGARLSEAMRAKPEDVDLRSGMIRFEITKTRKKGRASKHVPITKLTRELVKLALPSLPLAPWANVRRDLENACAELKIPRVTPNDLRRTHANWLREAGVDTSLIADVLGHTDSRMVERVYGRLRPEQLRDRVRASLH